MKNFLNYIIEIEKYNLNINNIYDVKKLIKYYLQPIRDSFLKNKHLTKKDTENLVNLISQSKRKVKQWYNLGIKHLKEKEKVKIPVHDERVDLEPIYSTLSSYAWSFVKGEIFKAHNYTKEYLKKINDVLEMFQHWRISSKVSGEE